MDDPGLSLFHGPDGLRISTLKDHRVEEEEREDQKRRHEEIQHLMIDFDDDDLKSCQENESSFNSSRKGSTIYNESQNLENGPTTNDFDNCNVFDNVDGSSNRRPIYNHVMGAVNEENYHQSQYDQNSRTNSSTEMSPNQGYSGSVNEERNSHGIYNQDYETPVNHLNQQGNYCLRNGFIEGYNCHGKFDEDLGGSAFNHLDANPNGRTMDDETCYKTAGYNSKEQMKTLYETRVKQNERLMEKLQQLETEKEDEKKNFIRKLKMSQAEIEKLSMNQKKLLNDLADAKAQVSTLQCELGSFKENNTVLEKTKQNLSEDLNIARSTINDLERKNSVLEQLKSLQANDKTNEKFLKQAQERHATEMRNMQNQYDILASKLNAKEQECATLEDHLNDTRRKNESLMVEKGNKMNQLANALRESQTQYHDLITSNDSLKMVKLQAQLETVTQEKENYARTIQDLQHKLEVAKSDLPQYSNVFFELTGEEETDSARQMKLGEIKSKNVSEIDTLRSELNKCFLGQNIKRKEINRLENMLAQKEKELAKAMTTADAHHRESVEYAKRVNQLENEMKTLLKEKAMKANSEIQKLSNHLEGVKAQCKTLSDEKKVLEDQLNDAFSKNQELVLKLQEKSTVTDGKNMISEFNKEYLEIHEKAIQRVRQEAEVEIVQLNVQLQQTQKELDRVKEVYIKVCGKLEQTVEEHKNEMMELREKYGEAERLERDLENVKADWETQAQLAKKMTRECERYQTKITELERDLALERSRKKEHDKKIFNDIEKAKDQAIKELRNSHPSRSINVQLPNTCLNHMDKISQLEDDCKRLEEKLSSTLSDQQKNHELQSKLEKAKVKIAQLEISQESWKKKYESLSREQDDLRKKINAFEKELEKSQTNANVRDLNLLRHVGEEELRQIKNSLERVKVLEKELMEKENQLKELDRIREERNDLAGKLSNQTKQFKQYVKSQQQGSAELSSGSWGNSSDAQKMRETMIRKVRKEIEQQVAEKLQAIEDNYKTRLLDMQKNHSEKIKEMESLKMALQAEKMQVQLSFEKREQDIVQNIGSKICLFEKELVKRRLKIDELQGKLNQRENEAKEDREAIAQIMSEWKEHIAKIQKEKQSQYEEMKKLKARDESLNEEIKILKEKEANLTKRFETLTGKYHYIKQTALHYKQHAESKEDRFSNERKRLEEEYKKVVTKVRQRFEAIFDIQNEQVLRQLKEIELSTNEELKKSRTKYKSKS